jgi:glycosyltransferase involved in cell wall biosynthesis
MNVSGPGPAPWLTVVIPSHCGERWIAESLRSLAAEAAQGIAILIIDSSPTPATRDVARGYADRLDLRVFERCDLSSWHAKTNFGVEMAQSTHVCWLGVDDLWLPGRAAAVRAWVGDAPQASLHFAPSAIVGRDGRQLGLWRCPFPAGGELPMNLVIERLLVQNFIAAPAPVFRRDAWLECGGLDGKLWYTADWDMWLKLAACGPVQYHDSVTIGFRVHEGSLTVTGSRDTRDFADQMQIVLNRHLDKLGMDSRGIGRVARASVAVNTALASAHAGDLSGLPRAAAQVLRLGPAGIRRYLRDSRIADRALARIRADWRALLRSPFKKRINQLQ